MNNYGFIKVATGVPKVKVANPDYNKEQIIKLIDKANEQNVKIFITPELSISAYTCADLFFQDTLLDQCEKALYEITEYTKEIDIALVVGMPVRYKKCTLQLCCNNA